MSNDGTTHLTVDMYRNKLKNPHIADAKKVVFIVDHNVPSDCPKTAASQKKMRDFAKENRVEPMQTEQDLEKLVHAHTAALLRYCTGLLGCEADAQDAVQKTFIKAWQQRRTLRGDGTDNECAWLYRIAYRTALDMLRAARRAANYPTPEPREQDPGISDELRTALAALPPLDRALVLERVLDGLDYAALARIHGRPAAYLRTRYHRAKKQLASRLREGEHHDE